MKKESVNTFNGGLNYDLNPLTTPNNILTDNVNGTFVTFNGDELALQNDAGNTKIQIPNSDPAEYVQLSPGFYPLAISEYGGILYIISGKSAATNVVPAVIDKVYSIGEIVSYNNKYYISVQNHTLATYSQLLDISYWTSYNTIIDAGKNYDKIEFGSYPSPNISSLSNTSPIGVPTKDEFIATSYITESVYLTDTVFNPGSQLIASVTLNAGNSNQISQWVDGQWVRRIFKVGLYQKLENSINDVTILYSSVSLGGYWFGNGTGVFNNTLFKGKLFTNTSIEEIDLFKIKSFTLTPSGLNYAGEIKLDYLSTCDINITTVNLLIKDGDATVVNIDYPIDNIVFALLGAAAYIGKTLTYTITPIFSTGIFIQEIIENIPSDYLNKYILKGSREIPSILELIGLQKNTSIVELVSPATAGKYEYDESILSGYEKVTSLALINETGDYVDRFLEVSNPNIFGFNAEGYSNIVEANQVGIYSITSNSLINSTGIFSNFADIIKDIDLYGITQYKELYYTINYTLPIKDLGLTYSNGIAPNGLMFYSSTDAIDFDANSTPVDGTIAYAGLGQYKKYTNNLWGDYNHYKLEHIYKVLQGTLKTNLIAGLYPITTTIISDTTINWAVLLSVDTTTTDLILLSFDPNINASFPDDSKLNIPVSITADISGEPQNTSYNCIFKYNITINKYVLYWVPNQDPIDTSYKVNVNDPLIDDVDPLHIVSTRYFLNGDPQATEISVTINSTNVTLGSEVTEIINNAYYANLNPEATYKIFNGIVIPNTFI